MSTLLEHAIRARGPIIEGSRVTFVAQGRGPIELLGDFNFWMLDRPATPMTEVAPEVWSCTLTLPEDAYIEYGFQQAGRRYHDPLNPRPIHDGMGHTNSFIWMPKAVDTPLATAKRGGPRGQIQRYQVEGRGFVVGKARTVHLYQAPVSEPTPLLVVFDGTGYLRKARMGNILDNLIAQQRIRPLSVAFVDPGGHGRTVEYACSDTTSAFIIECVLPVARQHLNLLDIEEHPGAYGIMGASMGGLMSLYIGLREPQIFGRVLCESGAFGGAFIYRRSVIDDLIGLMPVQPLKLWLDVGLNEWFIEPNRVMSALLRKRGYDLKYVEHTSGHNYPSWRNILWRGLEHLFGTAS